MNNNATGNLSLWTRRLNLCLDVRSTHRSMYFWIYSTVSCACIFSEYRHYFPGLKRTKREVSNSPLLIAVAKNQWSYTSTLPICIHGVKRANRNLIHCIVSLYTCICISSVHINKRNLHSSADNFS